MARVEGGKKTKVILRPCNLIISIKARSYYSFTICIKDVWEKNSKSVVGVVIAARTDGGIARDTYISDLSFFIIFSPCSPIAASYSHTLFQPPKDSKHFLLALFRGPRLAVLRANS